MRGTYKSEVKIVISIPGFWKNSNQVRELINNPSGCKYRLTENLLIYLNTSDEFVYFFEKKNQNSTLFPSSMDSHFSKIDKGEQGN